MVKIDSRLWTLADAAVYCGVSMRTVQRWIQRGELAAVRLGKKIWRIQPDALRAFIAERSGVTAAAPAVLSPLVTPSCAAKRLAEIIRLPTRARVR